MRVFLVVWFGQLLSMVGTSLTGFALAVWVFQARGSVTELALISVAAVLPGMLAAPLVGSAIDRWDRRLAMLFSDLVAGLSTVGMVALLSMDALEVEHIYVAVSINSVCTAVQMPAWSAATALLVPKRHLARAGGLVQLGQAAAMLVAPALAGAIMLQVGVLNILLADVASFFVGALTLLLVRFPRPAAAPDRPEAVGWKVGWRWISARPGMKGLLIFAAASNLCLGMVHVLITPLVLGFADASTLGLVMSTGGLGMLVGSLVMVVWGGPERKITAVLVFSTLQGALLLLGGLRPSAWLVAAGAFGALLAFPMVQACTEALWQTKVPPPLQGRVFSVRNAISASTLPLAYLLAGPLADQVFEPLLRSGGGLSLSLGPLIGVGPGRGIGLLFVAIGIFCVCLGLAAWLNPRVRLVESELPDHNAAESA